MRERVQRSRLHRGPVLAPLVLQQRDLVVLRDLFYYRLADALARALRLLGERRQGFTVFSSRNSGAPELSSDSRPRSAGTSTTHGTSSIRSDPARLRQQLAPGCGRTPSQKIAGAPFSKKPRAPACEHARRSS
jgi:hypothetical protein